MIRVIDTALIIWSASSTLKLRKKPYPQCRFLCEGGVSGLGWDGLFLEST